MKTTVIDKTNKRTFEQLKSEISKPINKQKQLVLPLENHSVVLHFMNENTIKITMNPNDCEVSEVINLNQTIYDEVEINHQVKIIKTEKMTVKFNQDSNQLSFFNNQAKLVLKQMNLLDGFNNVYQFEYDKNNHLYGIKGFGCNDDSTSQLLRTGEQIAKGGHQGYAGSPLIWSTSGYGILLDTVDATFTIQEGHIKITQTSNTPVNYYIIVGSPIDIQSAVALLSGKPPMFPKWAMGFSNSEWEIDEVELLTHVTTYREKQIPIDMFTLDFDWKSWGEDNYGEFRWNDKKFPHGSTGELKQQLDSLGIKLTGILKPRIHVDTIQGQYASENHFWIPNRPHYECYFSKKRVNDLDFSIKEVREWYFDHLKEAFDQGIVGYWNDEQDEGYPTMQGLMMQKALYEGQRRYTNQRVWSINRNFYLGAQKYAYAMWSGDIYSNFYTMETQRERMLSAICLGQVKWGMDIGGFQSTPTPLNYARWMQFGAFVPIYRVHGTINQQRQPWFFGEKAEKVAKEAIKLRYKLIPYIYSYERQATETGIGIVKPLIYDYPNDENLINHVESWMFGDYLLVSPVVSENDTFKSIYLPQGTWTDYHTGKKYLGGQRIIHQIDTENWLDLPLFIKEGAIMPTQEVLNYMNEKKIETIEIDVFPSINETVFNFYDDDGLTYDYEHGKYFKQRFTVRKELNHTLFTSGENEGTYTPYVKQYVVKFHGLHTKRVTVNGLEIDFTQENDLYGDVTIIKIEAGLKLSVILE